MSSLVWMQVLPLRYYGVQILSFAAYICRMEVQRKSPGSQRKSAVRARSPVLRVVNSNERVSGCAEGAKLCAEHSTCVRLEFYIVTKPEERTQRFPEYGLVRSKGLKS